MFVLATCKNEEDPIKNKDARVVTRLFINFSNVHGQLTQWSVSDRILMKFKLIQAFMVDLAICKNEEESSKNEETRVVTIFLPL